MEDVTLDIAHSEDQLTMNAEVRRSFLSLAMWLRFAGVIGTVLTVCGLGFLFFMYAEFSRNSLRDDEIFGLLLLIAGITFVGFLSRFALGYSSKIKKAFNQNSEVHLKAAINSAKNGVILIAIVGLVGTLFVLFVLGLAIYLTSLYQF